MRVLILLLLLSVFNLSYGMGEEVINRPATTVWGSWRAVSSGSSQASQGEQRSLLGNVQADNRSHSSAQHYSFCQQCRDQHGGKLMGVGCCFGLACIAGIICSIAGFADGTDINHQCEECFLRR